MKKHFSVKILKECLEKRGNIIVREDMKFPVSIYDGAPVTAKVRVGEFDKSIDEICAELETMGKNIAFLSAEVYEDFDILNHERTIKFKIRFGVW